MILKINGDSREVGSPRTVAELLAALVPQMPSVLVEHNGTALRRIEWNERPLADGDRIEIIRISAGG